MSKTWGGHDPSDPQFQQSIDAARQRADDRIRRTPPPKPTPMERWNNPKKAAEMDQARKNWKKPPKKEKQKRNWRGKKKG